MKKMRIALLCGGKSSEKEVSLNGGKEVYNALDKKKYEIFSYDPAYDLKKFALDSDKIDFAFIVLHGSFGEDGTIQGFLDVLGIPYQGAGVLGSSIAMNKIVSKRLYEHANIPVPKYITVKRYEDLDIENCIKYINFPLIVKPASSGSSIGITIASSETALKNGLYEAFKLDNEVLIEKYLRGTEITCGVIGNDDALKALPLIEIIPSEKHEFFDYKAKYEKGATKEICPAPIDEKIAEKAKEIAIKAHKVLYCKDYSRTDMILIKDEIFVLETNTIPGMTGTSLFPQSAKEAGMSFSTLLDKLVELGIQSKNKIIRL